MPSEIRIRQVQAELGLDYIQARNHVKCQEALRNSPVTKWPIRPEISEDPSSELETPTYSSTDSARRDTITIACVSLVWTMFCLWNLS